MAVQLQLTYWHRHEDKTLFIQLLATQVPCTQQSRIVYKYNCMHARRSQFCFLLQWHDSMPSDSYTLFKLLQWDTELLQWGTNCNWKHDQELTTYQSTSNTNFITFCNHLYWCFRVCVNTLQLMSIHNDHQLRNVCGACRLLSWRPVHLLCWSAWFWKAKECLPLVLHKVLSFSVLTTLKQMLFPVVLVQ